MELILLATKPEVISERVCVGRLRNCNEVESSVVVALLGSSAADEVVEGCK